MSSDDYFLGEELDSAVLSKLDEIEAAHFPPLKQPRASPHPPSPHPTQDSDSDFFDSSFIVDQVDLQRIDEFVQDVYQGKAHPIAGPSKVPHKFSRTASTGSRQTNLFGEIIQDVPQAKKSTGSSQSQMQRTKSTRNPFGQQAKKTKVWDQTAFAKTGWKKPKSAIGKGKGKGRITSPLGDNEGDEDIEFEQFPAPFVSSNVFDVARPSLPMKLAPDLLEAKHWIYPLNQPKRDYQFNIVRHCLFENTLVALPTGLGKTFIAGVVMLNFYRWFPSGKIVFVAPTKPLVAQQIEACHKTCGIPGHDAVVLTGQNPRAMRGRAWQNSRVFYMTPQTLINDLTTENCDPRDIVLIVVDEAHKGTGDYAYAQVIRYLMAKNPYHRVLALTATPGGTPDAVQSIVDSLHISRIEIRDEASLDLKDFIHKKVLKQHVIKMSEDVDKVKDLLAKFMEITAKPLLDRGMLAPHTNLVNMHPYRPQALVQEIISKPQSKWAVPALMLLGQLARGMGYLLEGTMGMCNTYMADISRDEEPTGGTRRASKKLRTDPNFQAVTKELATQRNRGFSLHPKMERLKELVIEHFSQNMDHLETRAMVFVTFREAVDEIVDVLNKEQPLIRAMRFVGQSTDKQGKRGYAQREQIEVLDKFKKGDYNVLVSTSIGEEGLDIGEVDMIVCYDAQKTPIRMLQRVGRTGRKRDGHVHVLLCESREEHNWKKAQETHADVQRTIVRGEQLELYSDVQRLLPDNVKPECLEKKMDIEEYVREEPRSRGEGSPLKGTKRKRNNDIMRNIPAGASTGFVSVSDLLAKGAAKKRKVKPKEFNPLAGEDDEVDEELEAGAFTVPRRTVSATAAPVRLSPKGKGKGKLRKAATISGTRKTTKVSTVRKKKAAEIPLSDPPSSLPFSQKGADDSDDMDIEEGIVKPSSSRIGSSNSLSASPFSRKYSTLHKQPHENIIDVSASDTESPRKSPSKSIDYPSTPSKSSVDGLQTGGYSKGRKRSASLSTSRQLSIDEDESMAWLIDEDEEPEILIINSSPVTGRQSALQDSVVEITDESPSRTGAQNIANCHQYLNKQLSQNDESFEILEDMSSIPSRTPMPLGPRNSSRRIPPNTRNNTQKKLNFEMPPPQIRAVTHSLASEPDDPEPSFPVRAAGKQTRRINTKTSDILSPPQRRRLVRKAEEPIDEGRASALPREGKVRKRPLALYRNVDNPWLDAEAEHSGGEVSEGSSVVYEEESESDRLFLQEQPETQVSPSYDQTLAYRQSLFSQAPARGKAPVFANRPVRYGVFGNGMRASRGQGVSVSSSPPQANDEPDEYAFGSFVVDDDAEISYVDNASSEL